MISAGQPRWRRNEKTAPSIAAPAEGLRTFHLHGVLTDALMATVGFHEPRGKLAL